MRVTDAKRGADERPRRRGGAAAMLLACGAATLFVAGCGDSKSTGTAATSASATTSGAAARDCSVDGKKIQYIGPLKSNPTLQVMAAGFSQEADRLGFDGRVMLAEDADPQKVIALGKQALAQGSDGLVVLAFDPALYPLMKEATSRGVPVVETHNPVPNAAELGISQVLRPDPAQYGAAAADAIGEQIGGRGAVAVTQGSFNPTENGAAEAFKREMAARYPDVEVLKPQLEGFDPAQAVSKAVSILQSDDKINAAYSTTGGGPVTWAGAQDQAGRRLAIIGMDYTRPNLDLIRAGKIFGIVAQPIYEEHALAVDALKEKICGGTPRAEVTPDSPIVTRANLQKYYDLLDRTGT